MLLPINPNLPLISFLWIDTKFWRPRASEVVPTHIAPLTKLQKKWLLKIFCQDIRFNTHRVKRSACTRIWIALWDFCWPSLTTFYSQYNTESKPIFVQRMHINLGLRPFWLSSSDQVWLMAWSMYRWPGPYYSHHGHCLPMWSKLRSWNQISNKPFIFGINLSQFVFLW